MIQFDIITLFPRIFDSYFNESILKRAQAKKKIKINIHDLRDVTTDKHRTVDDRPYGGGPGMILLVEPMYKAIKAIKHKSKARVIMLAPEGKLFNQQEAKRLSKYNQLILLCGRYEGFDARVEQFIDEKISIGQYVLAGGELPAMVVTEAVARHVKGVVGHQDALVEETFATGPDYVEYPQYSRPETFKPAGKKALPVPKILLSGNHAKIRQWRQAQSEKKR
ncbi:MAG: tRNA (guanosine(37)-N1)-methyltransferase TrmD [Candidatus Buchananbacteria bacterium RIFCSPLOWO2_01_FULL_56_15]|uniref:tRNA (guanine-N(1)-)-methyltransferase n=2 Tax=Candidatus Buchananiibacteriota TaxID=1817903 RepID=A0A1G1YE60_9BACT|nr:MAG: tRNA (guanosine(37)-N1)-methyltransferase TrmD [Candidatus Buchananbacteria bacterium RIFCSPHIGHO2_02_FULL_56_16]OGY55199.1 MAG: tRNA (guanosine(37)-N1)-methyltransferase TrmD [Candidatus Buchananbacteria bacterium RIFCSPLOWO2_01_FULL_56_15]